MRGFAYILAYLFYAVSFAHAQATSRIAFCLNLAHGIEEAAFKEKKLYITKEDDIRKQLTSGCSALRYEFTPKGTGGFRVTAEQNGESWVIDDQRELIQLSSPDDPRPAVGGGGKSGKTASPAAGPAGKPIGKPGDKTMVAGVAASKRMEQCFAKSKFNTEACRTFFEELDKNCGGENVPLKRLCLELEASIGKIDLADCIGDEENFGKCELRRRALDKKCSNPLRSASNECRGLAKFNASITPPTEAPVAPPKPAATESTAVRTPTQVAAVAAPHVMSPDPGYSRIEDVDAASAKTLEPSLRTLLRLRPVVYDSKMSRTKEMGFVTEEVELVNPQLVTYNSSGKAQTVKFSQFSALVTSGVQELYNMCKADGELQKDLISRMVSLERENGSLKKENAEFKKLLFNLSNDLQELKDKVKTK